MGSIVVSLIFNLAWIVADLPYLGSFLYECVFIFFFFCFYVNLFLLGFDVPRVLLYVLFCVCTVCMSEQQCVCLRGLCFCVSECFLCVYMYVWFKKRVSKKGNLVFGSEFIAFVEIKSMIVNCLKYTNQVRYVFIDFFVCFSNLSIFNVVTIHLSLHANVAIWKNRV